MSKLTLTSDRYMVSRATLEKVLAALDSHHTSPTGNGEEDNNDDVIEADVLLRKELESDQGSPSAAAELGRLGGKKGGRARAASLTPKRRKEIAVNAAKTRWAKR